MRNMKYKFDFQNKLKVHLLFGIIFAFIYSAGQGGASEKAITEMSMGKVDAPVTLIEYASFTCPHCADFHMDVMPLIKKEFVDSGEVKFIYREIYFDGPGLWAGLLARCKGKEKYFGMVNLLYNKQKTWAKGKEPQDFIDNLLSVGRQAGISNETSLACMQDQKKAEALVELFQKNSLADNITSTPSLVLNGELLQNSSYEELSEKIKKLLE